MQERAKLTPDQERLLREVARKRDSSWLGRIGSLGNLPLPEDQYEELWYMLMDELVATGLRPDSEPNERGLKLQELIDLLLELGLPRGDWALPELWRRIDLGVAEVQEKIEAAHLSGKERDKRFLPRLVRLLGDSDRQVRYYALQSLVLDLKKADEEMERRCWTLLREDPDDDVRGMAATCLGKIHFASLKPYPFRQLLCELKSPLQPPRAKGSIYRALFQIAARPPTEWPRSPNQRSFEESDIDWEKVAWLEDQLDPE